jgi:hypothetical membrane protein
MTANGEPDCATARCASVLTTETTPTTSRPGMRALAIGGALAVAATVLMIGALDAQRAIVSVSLLRRTISEYALGPQRWVFDSAVLLLAAGSLAILAALVHHGLARWRSGGAIALVLWSVGLATVVVFPKHDWAVGPSVHGDIHRIGSMVAFISLPVAVVLLSRPWLRHVTWRSHARWTFGLGLASALAFTPILFAIGVNATVGTPWWRVVPLGYVERLLVLSEVIAVLTVGLWAIAAANRPRLA